MNYTITIDEVLQATLEDTAKQGGRSPEEFVQFIVSNLLEEKYKKNVIAKIENSTFDEIKEIDTVVTVKKEEIATIKAEAEQAKIDAQKLEVVAPIEEKIEEEIIIEQ